MTYYNPQRHNPPFHISYPRVHRTKVPHPRDTNGMLQLAPQSPHQSADQTLTEPVRSPIIKATVTVLRPPVIPIRLPQSDSIQSAHASQFSCSACLVNGGYPILCICQRVATCDGWVGGVSVSQTQHSPRSYRGRDESRAQRRRVCFAGLRR
jgi:hypothetical protein